MKKRKTKFRAWDTKEKKMLSAEDLMNLPASITPDGSGFACLHHCSSASNIYYPELIPLQYTGLKDKNDKEIYEGDIVWVYYEDINDYKKTSKDLLFSIPAVVEYKEECFIFKAKATTNASHHCEVIGNRYENPELLK